MSDRPLTPHDVEQELHRFSDLLGSATSTHAVKARAEAIARATWEIAYSRAFNDATGTDEARKAKAKTDTADLLHKFREAQGDLAAVERRIRTYEEQIRAMQSIGASVRAAIGGPL